MTRSQRQVHSLNKRLLVQEAKASPEDFQREYEERMKRLGIDVNDTSTWGKKD